MAYVITDTCNKDELCIAECPVDCIHPAKDEPGFDEAPQLYIDPEECVDCGVCVDVCPTNSIHFADDLPEELRHFEEKNAAFFCAQPAAGGK